MERFAIIGLGRFGSRLAINLSQAGAEVIAIDTRREKVDALRDRVALALVLDATDAQALRAQGIDRVEAAVVGIGHNFEINSLATVLLKTMGVKKVISRAANAMQAEILKRIGADAVANPEDESADRWMHLLLSPFIVEHRELSPGFGLVQMPTPRSWAGKKLRELDVRRDHRVNIVAIKRVATKITAEEAGEAEAKTIERQVEFPMPEMELLADDVLILAGSDEALQRLPGE